MFWPWAILGAFAQIVATALMLAAMGDRSFVVTIAYIKTEPIQVALFGLVFLGDAVTLPMVAAILVATAGVVIMSHQSQGGMARRVSGRRCSGSSPAACSRSRRSAFAARFSISRCRTT